MKKALFVIIPIFSIFFFISKEKEITKKVPLKNNVKITKELPKRELKPVFVKEYLPEAQIINNRQEDSFRWNEHLQINNDEYIDEYANRICMDRESTEESFNYWECKEIQENLFSATINTLDRRINGVRAIKIDESDFEPIDYSDSIDIEQFNPDENNITN